MSGNFATLRHALESVSFTELKLGIRELTALHRNQLSFLVRLPRDQRVLKASFIFYLIFFAESHDGEIRHVSGKFAMFRGNSPRM